MIVLDTHVSASERVINHINRCDASRAFWEPARALEVVKSCNGVATRKGDASLAALPRDW